MNFGNGYRLKKNNLNRLRPFIIRVNTANSGFSNNDQFQFTGALGNYFVKAKQSGSLVATYTGLIGQQTITLPSSGIYDLEVFPSTVSGLSVLRFDDSGDILKPNKIKQFGVFNDNRNALFNGCENLSEIANDCEHFNTITSGNQMFQDNNLTSLPSAMTLDVLTDGSLMFWNNSLTSLPSAMTLDVLTDGQKMFRSNSLTSLPSAMILDVLTNGAEMFQSNSLTSLPSVMTLAALTNGNLMFLNNSLTSLPSAMSLTNLTNGRQMFQNNFLASLPAAMTLAALTNGSFMFQNNLLTSLPNGVVLHNLTDGERMFEGNTLDTARYSQLLIDMESGNNNLNVDFHGGNSQYNSSGQTARTALINNQNWVITDGGLI